MRKGLFTLHQKNDPYSCKQLESTLLHLEEKMLAASRTCSKYQLKTQILLCLQLGPHIKRESSSQVLPLLDRAGLRILERLDSPTPEV